MIDQDAIQARFEALNERDRRLFAASEARAAGRGGITAVSRATGVARSTIGRGPADLRSGALRGSERVRWKGGGQKPATGMQPGILQALNDLVEPSIRGDPEAPLRWVSLSQRHLSAALAKRGFIAGQKLVGLIELRGEAGFDAPALDEVVGLKIDAEAVPLRATTQGSAEGSPTQRGGVLLPCVWCLKIPMCENLIRGTLAALGQIFH